MSAADSTLPAPATRYPGVGPRAIATLIDSVLGFIAIGVPLLILFGKKSTTNTTGGTTTSYSTSDPKVLALWFVLAIAYYVAFEAGIGATPGKLVLGLRVRDATGKKSTPAAALIRNLLRPVDAFPYVVPYLVGAIAIWNDDSAPGEGSVRRRRRIGDRLAGTIVTYC
jgi:uncharacterized RDD family membrane protein YckC